MDKVPGKKVPARDTQTYTSQEVSEICGKYRIHRLLEDQENSQCGMRNYKQSYKQGNIPAQTKPESENKNEQTPNSSDSDKDSEDWDFSEAFRNASPDFDD